MNCKSCGNEINEDAAFCSKCGVPVEQPRIDTEIQTEPTEAQAEAVHPKISLWKICKYAILAIAIIIGIGRALDPYSNILYIDEMRESYKCAQEVILDNLSTTVAEFPPFEPDFVTQRAEKIEYEGEEYMVRTVTAYVEAENIFGAMMKCNYVVEIGLPVDRTVDNYIYTIIELN